MELMSQMNNNESIFKYYIRNYFQIYITQM